MDYYDIAKDILVPLVAPTVAASALIFTFYLDRRRIRTRQKNEIENSARAIYRDALFLREHYRLIMLALLFNEKVAPERYTVAEAAFERIFKSLYGNPSVYDQYFKGVHLKIKEGEINLEKLPLMLSEFEVRGKTIRQDNKADPFFMFGNALLIYAGTEDKDVREESAEILSVISEKKPELFERFWSKSPPAAP